MICIRKFAAVFMTGCWLAGASAANADDAAQVKIQVDSATAVNALSPDFIGFGYESSAVAQTNYFGGDNATLIQLYRNLSDHGLIRIGGCPRSSSQARNAADD